MIITRQNLLLSKKSGKSCPIFIMKNKIIYLLVLGFLMVGAASGQKTVQGKICGNPNIKCKTDATMFGDSDIKFEVPRNSVISESEPFYAVILKSSPVKDFFGGDEDCKAADTEEERLATQKLFPNNKVFSQRCGYDSLYYTGAKENTVFMAVYAGKTLAQAQSFLKTVNVAGKFKGAYIKKLQAQFNGT
jgi:hypothetical protein